MGYSPWDHKESDMTEGLPFLFFFKCVLVNKSNKIEMETHSNILAWEISWTEEPGGLPSMGVTKELGMAQ